MNLLSYIFLIIFLPFVILGFIWSNAKAAFNLGVQIDIVLTNWIARN